MAEKVFQVSLVFVGLAFTLFFLFFVLPPLIDNPDVVGAFAAGFVNPYAAGYATDVVFCWLVLAIWVVFEARTRAIKNGWICLVVGVVPGVAVGFAAYLLLRTAQLNNRRN